MTDAPHRHAPGHLSKEINFPELALKCCETVLARDAAPDADVRVARRDGGTGLFTVKAAFSDD